MNAPSFTPLPWKTRLVSSWFVRNRLVRIAVDWIHLWANLFVAAFGSSPRLVGQKRFVHELRALLVRHRRPVSVSEDCVWVDGKIVARTNPHLSAFLPIEAVTVGPDQIHRLESIVEGWLYGDRSVSTHEYYRATWLYVVTFAVSMFSNVMIVLSFVEYFGRFDAIQNVLSTIWIVSNLFLLAQMYIFHRTRLRSLGLEKRLVEATPEEETALRLDARAPEAVVLVPTYKEEPELLRRSLLCQALQLHSRKKIVLLLGNEVEGADEETTANTARMHEVVDTINRTLSHWNLLARNAGSSRQLAEVYTGLAQLVRTEAAAIEASALRYPTDTFVVEEVLRPLSDRWEASSKALDESSFEAEKAYLVRWSETKLEIFMRMKYANVEHEKTKAGNLTAYLDLINRDWREEWDDAERRWSVVKEAYHGRYRYVSIFDCDTIAKPGYLLRKISYLQRPGTERIGLIQSPYVVPFDEPTVTGAASGVHSYWFLPISLGLSSYSSAFWLGFNSCWRVEAIESIPSFVSQTVIEDVEVSLQLVRNGYRIVTSPEQQCMTYSPKDIRGVQVQRTRWASGGLRILWDFVSDVAKRRYKPKSFREFLFRVNYVVNLNLLPVFITTLFVMQSPLHYMDVGYVMMQFAMYLWMYFLITSRKTKYRFRQLFDGLVISFLMNFYYLRGLKTSIQVLFKPGKNIVFQSTPRQADVVAPGGSKQKASRKRPIDAFEIVGSVALLYVFVSAIAFNWTHGYQYDVFPIYQATCIVYSIGRFVGWRAFFSAAWQSCRRIGAFVVGRGGKLRSASVSS